MTKNTIIPETPTAADYGSEEQRGLVPDVADPLILLKDWLSAARKTELNDSNAMALATVDAEGLPDVRMVLLKDVSEDGLTFYTHETSTKGQQLLANPKAALLFHWKSQRRPTLARLIQCRARLTGRDLRLFQSESNFGRINPSACMTACNMFALGKAGLRGA